MTDLALSCMVCKQDSGSRVVCSGCQPLLNDNQKLRAMQLVHKLTYDRDGGQCVHCGHSAEWEAGELCANHKETQGSRPDLKYDLDNTELTCSPCNLKHADRKLPSQQIIKNDDKPKASKKRYCSEPHCPLLPVGNGKCWKHQKGIKQEAAQ